MKNLIKSILFILIGAALFVSLNALYVKTDTYQSMNEVAKFNDVPEEIAICNLGNSHGTSAFIYAETDAVCFNFAIGAQRYCYDKRILENYADHLEPGCFVFIPVSYFSFYAGENSDNFESRNYSYYSFLPKDKIINFTYADYVKYKLFPILTADYNIVALKEYLTKKQTNSAKNTNNVPVESDAGYNASESGETNGDGGYSDEELAQIAQKRAEIVYDLIEEGRAYKEDVVQDLSDIIAICEEKQYTPVLVTTPFTTQYNNCFSAAFISEFRNDVNAFADSHDVLFLDYSHDEAFQSHTDYFDDADHLTAEGGLAFTRMILDDLAALGIRF